MDEKDQGKVFSQLIAKAWTDAAFKQRLLREPATVLEEYGLEVPAGVTIRIVEDTDTLMHVSLPPRPSGKELTEEDLTAVAGGLIVVETRDPFPPQIPTLPPRFCVLRCAF
jgi:hypothetical protein